MKEYEQKIHNIINNAEEDVIFQAHQAYKQGYEDGKELLVNTYVMGKGGGILEAIKKAEYNRGLNDAWDAARKIAVDITDGGYSLDELREIFNETLTRIIFKRNTASEAIAKIKAYEDEQKQDAEIKVGDEVITKYKDHAVAVRDTYYVGEDREPFALIWFGTHMSSCRVNELSKTGRHFPQIAEVLKELRGAE